MAKVKAHEIREKPKAELLQQLDTLKTELAQLRVAKQTSGAASKLCTIKIVRRSIARVLTVLNTKEKNALRKLYKNKKYKPLDLRSRKTKRERLQLTHHEKKQRTCREKRRTNKYPRRKYYLKI